MLAKRPSIAAKETGKCDDIAAPTSGCWVCIFHVHERHPSLVCVRCHMPVGDAHGHPHCPPFPLPFAYHFQNPTFTWVCECERFALGRVPVSVDEVCHHGDGLRHCLCALQRRPNQTAIVHDGAVLPLCELLNAPKRCFPNGKLMFIDVPYDVKRLFNLIDFAQEHARVPVPDFLRGAGADVAHAGQSIECAVEGG